MPRIPIIEDLTAGPVPLGSNLLLEFAGASQWYDACLAIAAGWLKQGGRVSYNAEVRPPDEIRSKLRKAGLNVETLEGEDKLRIWDWYTVTLGKKSSEKYAYDSLKVADLSIRFANEEMNAPQVTGSTGWFRIADNISTLARFNDEKVWIEFFLARAIPSNILGGRTTTLNCILTGVHSNSAYEQLEAACDGVIDLKVEEVGGEVRNLIRIRKMRDVGFDSRWNRFSISENVEVTLESHLSP